MEMSFQQAEQQKVVVVVCKRNQVDRMGILHTVSLNSLTTLLAVLDYFPVTVEFQRHKPSTFTWQQNKHR